MISQLVEEKLGVDELVESIINDIEKVNGTYINDDLDGMIGEMESLINDSQTLKLELEGLKKWR